MCQSYYRWTYAVLLLLSVVAVGCNEKSATTSPSPSKATTPQEGSTDKAGPLPAQNKEISADLEKFQGRWEQLTSERGGEEIDERKGPDSFRSAVEFKDDTFTFYTGKRAAAKGKVKLDSTASPKTIDLIYEGNADQTLRGQVRLGIYEFNGDTLRLCCADLYSKGTRPKEFKTAKGDEVMLQTFKKEK